MKVNGLFSILALSVAAGASAQLVTTTTDAAPNTSAFVKDGVLSANEYGAGNSQTVVGNGNTGFGGTLGNGALFFDTSATNFNLGFQQGADLNDNVVIYIDSRSGGFTDAQMNDTSDGGRAAVSNLGLNSDETFGIQPDYAIVLGNFGVVAFELAAGGAGSLIYINDSFDGTFNSATAAFREYTLPKSALSIGNQFDYIVAYTAGSGFLSNEGLPGQAFFTATNPGEGTVSQTNAYSNYNRYVAVPEPASMAVLGLGLAAFRKRRAKK